MGYRAHLHALTPGSYGGQESRLPELGSRKLVGPFMGLGVIPGRSEDQLGTQLDRVGTCF